MTAAGQPERELEAIRGAIAERFGDRAKLAHAYADLLCGDGIERGVIGPREADRIWERHLLNSAALAPLLPQQPSVVDLGSGAGLPGIPLAIARPDVAMTLLEPLQRRVRFLAHCLERLELPNVSIHHGRAEQGVPHAVDVVVARAVASVDKLVTLSTPLLRQGGALLAIKGENAAREISERPAQPLGEVEIIRLAAPGQPVTVVRVTGIGKG
ncbi:MAG: 16S rRNA (guanine(527)-N(7))-methyltransferase RsmG [Frankiaceae bacterium]|nr:16S rRNA (guanine(527)-N(7))-methyltransferase RsmG [Frankiaceae bacterium]